MRDTNIFAMEALSLFIVILLIIPVILILQMRKVIAQVREENETLSELLRRLEPIIRELPAGAELTERQVKVPKSTAPEKPGDNLDRPLPPQLPGIGEVDVPPVAAAPPTPPAPPSMAPSSVSLPTPPPIAYDGDEGMHGPERAPRRDLEKIIGENLMSKIGILALIIGIGFFIKFAIDNNWINEVGRTVIGLAAGIGLWTVAFPLRNRYRNFSSVLAGGGFAICFVTVAVAYNYYSLFGSGVAFGIFVALAAAMIGIALRFDRRELAMTGFIGGFVAPFLSAGDTGSCLMLFGYMTVLNAGIFIVTLKRDWWELAASGCLLTWTVTAVYTISDKLTAADSAILLCFATLFVIMFSIPLATVLNRREGRPGLFSFLLVAAGVNFFSYLLAGCAFIADVPVLCRAKGIVPAVDAAVSLLLFFRFYRGHTDRLLQNLLLGGATIFTVLIIPIQFSDPSVIAVCFAVLTLAFAGVYSHTRRRLFATAAALLAFIDIMTLLLCHPVSVYAGNDLGAVLSYGLCAICYIAISWLVSRKWQAFLKFGRPECRIIYILSLWTGIALICASAYLLTGLVFEKTEPSEVAMTTAMAALLLVSLYGRNSGYAGWLLPGAGALFFVIWCGNLPAGVLYIAVMAIQGRRAFRHRRLTAPFGRNGYTVYFSLSASVFTVTAIEYMLRAAGLCRYYSAGFSVGLIVCGAILLAAGLRYRDRIIRIVGISIFGLLLLKLVVYDIWSLPMIGRIIVFILLGAVLLAISFLYQRLRKTIFGADTH